MSEINTFDPVLFSIKENEFLLEVLGEPTILALRKLTPPVNPRAVKPILDRVNELQELDKHEGLAWGGIEPIKATIKAYLRENTKWASDHKRNKRAPRYPSLYSYDGKGRPHRSGPGSDNGRVRSYFGPAGERIPFEIQLIPDNVAEWVAPGFTEKPTSAALFEDPATNRIECRIKVGDSVCGHTESYKPDSRASHAAARARISKHLRKATLETEAHRELHTLEFGE